MLGIRLKPEEERRLERHARDVGRPKSAIAREWIVERRECESVEAALSRAAASIAKHERDRLAPVGGADAVLVALDAIDGGYDWGEDGPPA